MPVTQEQINRINELAHLSKERELTAEEKAEQAQLRQAYVAAVRSSLRGQLDNTYVVDPKTGKKMPVREANAAARRRGETGVKIKLK
jgi:uncharacterized protein YnzC (UPF0291/DUF896 family)